MKNGNISVEFYSLNQLCEQCEIDLNQLQHIVIKYKLRLWVYLPNVKIFEAPENRITSHIFKDIDRLSSQELKKLGYTIDIRPNKSIEETSIIFSKEGASFCKLYRHIRKDSDSERIIKILHLGHNSKTIKNTGFIELCDNSFTNPINKVHDLFNNSSLTIDQAKSEHSGYERYLDTIYPISLKNTYVNANYIDNLIIPELRHVADEKVYSSIKLTPQDRKTITEMIKNETNVSRKNRIKEYTEKYKQILDKKFPKNTISIEKVVSMLYHLEKPIYHTLNKKQVSKNTYTRNEREERNKKYNKNK